MLVAVGSDNPVKVEAVRRAFTRAFGSVDVIPVRVDSGVSPQPVDEEGLVGAINRAKRSLAKVPSAMYGVGIEGCLTRLFGHYFCTGFVAVVDRSGRLGLGTSGWFQCPETFASRMIAGEELGDLIDDHVGRKGIKRSEGAIGVFTRGLVSRVDLYEHGVYMALARFLAGKLWPGEGSPRGEGV